MCVSFFTYFIDKKKCFVIVDVNECVKSPCSKDTENCHNTVGSYKCKCKKGWVRTKKGDCTKKKPTTKTKTKKTKKNSKGKKASGNWEDELKAEYSQGKFLTDGHMKIGSLLHTFYFGALLLLYKFERYNVLAFFVLTYGVAVGYFFSIKGVLEADDLKLGE